MQNLKVAARKISKLKLVKKKMFGGKDNMEVKKISMDSGIDISSDGRYSPNMTDDIDHDDVLDDAIVERGVEGRSKEDLNRPTNYFKLSLTIVSGKDLVAMDHNHKSDPYVTVLMDEKILCKTQVRKKTLTPHWDETFNIVTDRKQTLLLKVYDKDLVGKDLMGQAEFDLESCALGEVNQANLILQDGGVEHLRTITVLGSLVLRVTLSPMSHQEKANFESKSRSRKSSRLMTQMKHIKHRDAIVHVKLIESSNLVELESRSSSKLYCKLTIGNESHSSRAVGSSSNTPGFSSRNEWHQSFDFFWIIEHGNDLSVDLIMKDTFKDNFVGKVSIDLGELAHEVGHNLRRIVEDGTRDINLEVTISGISPSVPSHFLPKLPSTDEDLKEKYSWKNTFSSIRDVGHLSVKVVRAEGLQSADFLGESDPYCVLKLGNSRLQTHTVSQTLEPVWDKGLEFEVSDINQVLELTVYDEDGNHEGKFLGKMLCPLLEIRNGMSCYDLKDKTLLKRAKGGGPKFFLEMNLHWNPIRGSVQTLRQPNIDEKDSKQNFRLYRMSVSFTKNITRVKIALPKLDDRLAKEFMNVLKGKKTFQSICIFLGIMIGILFFDLWMIPFGLLFPFTPHLVDKLWFNKENKSLEVKVSHNFIEDSASENSSSESGEVSGDSDADEFQKTSFQETLRMIHDGVEFLAHTLESIKNVFNLSVPLLSCLAISLLVFFMAILYFVPFRVLLIIGLTKKFVRRSSRSNNLLKNYISKVPDQLQLEQRQANADSELSRTRLAEISRQVPQRC